MRNSADPFKEDRATGNPQEAHTSNFLHPVMYYYDGKMPPFNADGSFPTPKRLHHIVEDFLTEWYKKMFYFFMWHYPSVNF